MIERDVVYGLRIAMMYMVVPISRDFYFSHAGKKSMRGKAQI